MKLETSKKIALFSAICFVVVVIFTIFSMMYSMIANIQIYDTTAIVTLITVSGAAFGTTSCFYYSKAKIENIIKLKRSFLEEKYNILKNLGMLNIEYAQQDILNEVNSIDGQLNIEEEKINQEEISYNG